MAADALAVERLLEHLEARRKGDARDNSLLRLSGAGQCARRLGYRLLGAPSVPEESSSLAIFAIGHAYHAMVQQWLSEMGWTRPELVEVPLVDRERRIKGTTDAVSVRLNSEWLPDEAAGTRVIFEIKSITNHPKEHLGKPLAGAFSRLEKPKERHLDQANCYARLWNEGVAAGEIAGMTAPLDHVTRVCLIYAAKDGEGSHVPLKVFTQRLSEQRWQRLEGQFGKIWRCLDAGELPERDYDPFSRFSPCRFCEYQPYCLVGLEHAEQAEGGSDWAAGELSAMDAP